MKLLIIGFGSFLLITFIFFTILKMSEPEKKEISSVNSASPKVNNKYTKSMEKKYKNLQKQLESITAEKGKSKAKLDSALNLLTSQEKNLNDKEEQIEKLNEQLTKNENQEKNAQDLAKTFATMKTEEMRPILHNIDNKTIRMIYENINNRMRKNFLLALTPQRAAALTKQLAAAN